MLEHALVDNARLMMKTVGSRWASRRAGLVRVIVIIIEMANRGTEAAANMRLPTPITTGLKEVLHGDRGL